jgi:hypothetical protein
MTAAPFVHSYISSPLIRDRVQRATTKKTLTLPKWINDLAEEHKINFSQVLQEALKERLDIRDP